jgi:hypothetical protein
MDDEESDGTRKVFTMTGPILDALQNGGSLLVDEMDVRLHPFILLPAR